MTIAYVCETWLEMKERETIDLIKNKYNCEIYDKSSIEAKLTNGRPYGGTLWIISRKLTGLVEIEFINNKISKCTVNLNNNNQ